MKITTTNNYKAETLSVDMRDQDRSYNTVTITVFDDYVNVRINYDDFVLTLPTSLGMKLMETALAELNAISQSESTS